jgi:hypothetical protein
LAKDGCERPASQPAVQGTITARLTGYVGSVRLRTYVQECFDEEIRPAEVWFGEPQVDGDMATVEYWAVTYPNDRPLTISGCTLLRFNHEGLVAEARDYSHVKEGRLLPPAGLFH